MTKQRSALYPLLIIIIIFSGCAPMKSMPSAKNSSMQKAAPVVSEIGNADREVEKAISDDSLNSYYLFLESQIQKNEGRISNAVMLLKKAVEQDPGSIFLKKELAVLYLHQEDNEKALQVVEDILKQDPDSVDALILAATIQKTLNKDADTKQIYERVLKNDPQRKNVYKLLGKLYLDEGDLDNAFRIFEQMTQVFPDDYIGHYYVGKIHLMRKETAEAEAAFLKTLDIAPTLIEPRLDLIQIYQAENKKEKIISLYEEILSQYPGNSAVEIELALLYLDNGRIDEANEMLKALGERAATDRDVIRAVIQNLILQGRNKEAVVVLSTMAQAAPEDADIHYAAGLAQFNLEDFEAAYQQFSQVDPESELYPNSVIHMAIIDYKNEDIEGGIKLLETAINQVPEAVKPELIPYLSSFYKSREEYDKALAIVQQGLGIEPENPDLLFELGVIYDKLGNTEAAVGQMQKVIVLKPDHADALNYIGYTYADKGINLDEAEQLITKALNADPENGYILDSLGWLYYRKGEHEKAASTLEKAVALVPDDPILLEHLGDVYAALNNDQKALEFYDRALSRKKDDAAQLQEKINLFRKQP